MDNPEKLFYRIGEVSRLSGVKPHVLRYWESEFKQIKPSKTGTGQRRYRRRDLETILEIKRLLHDERYTIAGAKKALRDSSQETDENIAGQNKKRELERAILELKNIREMLTEQRQGV